MYSYLLYTLILKNKDTVSHKKKPYVCLSLLIMMIPDEIMKFYL